MDRTSIRNTTSQQQQEQWTRSVSSQNAAMANEYFEQFVNASSLKHILGYYRGIMDNLHLRPTVLTQFYPKLRANLTSWRAKAVWKKFDSRASHKCYGKGRAVPNTRVLIIGAGPCGLRTAIEAQLLGAKVVVIEKRDRFSRNNVLHLWPFVIEDLRMLGAKKFHGKFCAGAIDHISIRQLQCILLKVALLLGVEVHTEVSFEKLIEPQAEEKIGWRAELQPSDHPVSQYEFDVIIGADGKRNTLQGFSRKEFRGKLAIAITANFINKKTEAEARVEEISGVAFIFNQKFFKELHETTRIDLENIVYYKDDTHYFVMTAKKASLLEKGVIKQDLADTEKLLAPDNVDRDALQRYAIEAANFSTNYQLPDLEFAVNHYGQPDIAMFDFTSMYAAENASKVLDRNGHKLLMILVGDSLLEPFWPTGSGCARGFLSSLDAAWAIRGWGSSNRTPLDVLAERESVYRLLAQTTPDNLNKDWKSYTLDPATRYPNLNRIAVTARQVACLYDTDDPTSLERMLKRNAVDKAPNESLSKKRRRGTVDNDVLLTWLSKQLKGHEEIQLTSFASIFKDGNVLCAIIHHYRPDLLDYNTITDEEPSLKNQLAFDVLEKELGIPPVMTGIESISTEDYLTIATYLTEIYDTFRGEIPHIKHPKLELPESTKMTAKLSELTSKTLKSSNIHPITSGHQVTRPSSRHKRHIDASAGPVPGSTVTALPPPSKQGSIDRKSRKRKTLERMGASVHHDKAASQTTRTAGTDEDLVARIKSLEDKWRDPQPVEKKPKDLLRAIGKIETSDWNIKEIEKKIMENKLGKPSKAMDKEKVPKWSKEQFLARQNKMERQHYNRQDSSDAKFADIDKCIQKLDQKLKEGTTRDLGTKKVASIKENLVSKVPTDSKRPEKSPNRTPVLLPTQSASEFCHFCGKRVYLMERLSAEGRFFHHGCFKCQYCHTQLRLGSYAFDRDGMYGYKFFCVHHFGMEGELPKVTRKPSLRLNVHAAKSPPDKGALPGIGSVDLLDRVQTPERAEFSNLSTGNASSKEESLSQMDEDEWTDRNFGASCAELGDSDDESSSESDSDIDDDDEEDAYDDAVEDPETKEGAMKWTERWKHSYKGDSDSDEYSSSDGSSYYENSSDDEESDTATEGEDEIRARELRRQEVQVEPPVVHTDTGTDTEVLQLHKEDGGTTLPQNTRVEGLTEDAQQSKNAEEVQNNELLPDILSVPGSDISKNNIKGLNVSRSSSNNSLRVPNLRRTSQSDNLSRSSSSNSLKVPRKSRKSKSGSRSDSMSRKASGNISKSSKSGNDSNLNSDKSGSNLSVNSCEFKSAESNSDLDDRNEGNMVLGKLTVRKSTGDVQETKTVQPENKRVLNISSGHTLTKSATFGNIVDKKPLRNFVIPKKDKLFGQEFIPKYQTVEQQPLLVIKRTPSKINLPKETKPKVAVNTKVLDTKKYFGVQDCSKKPPKGNKSTEGGRKIEGKNLSGDIENTVKSSKGNMLTKQQSLPETTNEKLEVRQSSFNFEVEDDDLKDIDGYIEDLLKNEQELEKPIDPEKYRITPGEENEGATERVENEVDSSIEDLLKALEAETGVKDDEIESKEFMSKFTGESSGSKPQDQIEDLLSWIDDLDHDAPGTKITRSFSDVKYKNLERVLKAHDDSIKEKVVRKIPSRNLSLFEQRLKGRPFVERRRELSEDSDSDDNTSAGRRKRFEKARSALKRSKTEVQLRRNEEHRHSIELDMGNKVDIKKMMQKFECSSNDGSGTDGGNKNVHKRSFSIKRNSLQPAKGDKLDTLLKRNSFGGSSVKSEDNKNTVKTSIENTEQQGIRRSLTKSKSVKNVIKKFESSTDNKTSSNEALSGYGTETELMNVSHSKALENTLRDLEKFVQETIASIGTKYDDLDSNEKDGSKKITENINVDNKIGAKPKEIINANTILDKGAVDTKSFDLKATEFLQAVTGDYPNLDPKCSSESTINSNCNTNNASTEPNVVTELEMDKSANAEEGPWCAQVSSATQFFLSPENQGSSASSRRSSAEDLVCKNCNVNEQSTLDLRVKDDCGSKNENYENNERRMPEITLNDVSVAHDFSKAVDSTETSTIDDSVSVTEQFDAICGKDLDNTSLNFETLLESNLDGSRTPVKEDVDIDALYAKVNQISPIAPKRTKKLSSVNQTSEPKPLEKGELSRQERVKDSPIKSLNILKHLQLSPRRKSTTSFNGTVGRDDCDAPIPPQRKRATTVSPMPRRKRADDVKKEVVTSFHVPKAQNVNMKCVTSNDKLPDRNGSNSGDDDKDCCIQ